MTTWSRHTVEPIQCRSWSFPSNNTPNTLPVEIQDATHFLCVKICTPYIPRIDSVRTRSGVQVLKLQPPQFCWKIQFQVEVEISYLQMICSFPYWTRNRPFFIWIFNREVKWRYVPHTREKLESLCPKRSLLSSNHQFSEQKFAEKAKRWLNNSQYSFLNYGATYLVLHTNSEINKSGKNMRINWHRSFIENRKPCFLPRILWTNNKHTTCLACLDSQTLLSPLVWQTGNPPPSNKYRWPLDGTPF